MRRGAVLAVALLLVSAALAGTYRPATYMSGGGGGGGLGATLHVSGFGETPTVQVVANTGERVLVTVSYAYTGNTMFSGADVAKTALVATDTVSNYTEVHYLPQAVRAFDGDEIQLWMDVTFVDQGGDNVELTETFTVDIPGAEMKHIIVQSVDFDSSACTSSLYQDYVDEGATIYEYGTGGDLPMAWAMLDSTDWDGVDNRDLNRWQCNGAPGDYTTINASGENQFILARCPIENLLPDNATVVDGRLNIAGGQAINIAIVDTMVAIMNQVAGDTIWWDSANAGGWGGSEPGLQMASWRYQLQGYDDAIDAGNVSDLTTWGHPATSQGRWQLGERTTYFDWGKRFQFTSEASATNGFSTPRFGDGDWFGFKINRLVQFANEGETNNGILYFFRDSAGGGANLFSVQGPHSVVSGELPFYTISYIDGLPYEAVYPLGPDGTEAVCVATFSTDDGRVSVNDNFSEAFEARDLSYSIFLQKSFEEYDATFWSEADAERWLGRGMELGQHGFIGTNMAAYDTAGVDSLMWGLIDGPSVCNGITAADTAGIRHQMRDLDPCWMTSQFGSNNLVGRTGSINLGTTTVPSLWAAHEVGLLSERAIGANVTTLGGTWPNGGWQDVFEELELPRDAPAATEADSAYFLASAHDLTQPVNAAVTATTAGSYEMVGGRLDSPSQATIEANVTRLVTSFAGKNIGGISWYAHDEKDIYSDDNGITATEIGYVLDQMESHNVAVLNHGAVADWRLGLMVPSVPPATWGNYWKPTDPDNGVWKRMRWVDACKLQGIKRQGD